MEIVVLNGSPKGEVSVTMQYVKYLEKRFPQHTFVFLHIAQRLKRLEHNEEAFAEVIQTIQAADLVLWAFPVYIMCVHAHYKRFIELIFERNAQAAFAGKYAAALVTSMHFFDHTALNYIRAISDDLDMIFIDSYSANSTDLISEAERDRLNTFAALLFDSVQSGVHPPKTYNPVNNTVPVYTPTTPVIPVETGGKRVMIVHDASDPQSNLGKMVERLQQQFTGPVTSINLHEVGIKGSCQGCIRCGATYICAYEGRDNYVDMLRDQVMTADILIFAGAITDRYLSSLWKTFFDRAFVNTHTPFLVGQQIAYVFSGPLSAHSNLREMLSAYSETQMANLVGFVSDELQDSQDVDEALAWLAHQAVSSAHKAYIAPQTFLGEGGRKIFRDGIWGRMRVTFIADHRAYKRMGFYKDFPQRDLRMRLRNLFIVPLLDIPAARAVFNKHIKEGMITHLREVVEQTPVG